MPRLTTAECQKLLADGVPEGKAVVKHPDGGGLYFVVRPGRGTAAWLYHSRCGDKHLGSFPDMTPKQAREALEDHRVSLRSDTPAAKPRRSTAVAAGKPFKEAVAEWLKVAAVKWADKTRRGTEAALLRLPLASKSVGDITTDDVLADVRDAFATKPKQREDIKQNLARVIDSAIGHGWFVGENPAKFEGPRRELWPVFEKSNKHHARVSRNDLPSLYASIVDGDTARALRFLILTTARSGEVEGAKWAEIFPAGANVINEEGNEETLTGDTWIVPAERMKLRKRHFVPLTSQAMALLGKRGKPDELLFGKLPSNAMLNLLQKTHPGKTVHGLRSTFRDWAPRQTVPVGQGATVRDLAELALSHELPDSSTVERSYARDGLLDLRRPLMEQWVAFAAR